MFSKYSNTNIFAFKYKIQVAYFTHMYFKYYTTDTLQHNSQNTSVE